MIFQISSSYKGITNEKRLYPDKAFSSVDANLLLEKFRSIESQCGNVVSEIKNDYFFSVNSTTGSEKIFQIENS